MGEISIVDYEPLACGTLAESFKGKGDDAITSSRGEEALSEVESERPLVMLLDARMPGMEVLGRAKGMDPRLGVSMVTAVRDVEIAQKALRMGPMITSEPSLTSTISRRGFGLTSLPRWEIANPGAWVRGGQGGGGSPRLGISPADRPVSRGKRKLQPFQEECLAGTAKDVAQRDLVEEAIE